MVAKEEIDRETTRRGRETQRKGEKKKKKKKKKKKERERERERQADTTHHLGRHEDLKGRHRGVRAPQQQDAAKVAKGERPDVGTIVVGADVRVFHQDGEARLRHLLRTTKGKPRAELSHTYHTHTERETERHQRNTKPAGPPRRAPPSR